MKIAESSPKGKKALREKEKLLVTSNFSFSHSVFKGLVLQTWKNKDSFGRLLDLHVVNDFQEKKLEDRRRRFLEDRDKFENEQDVGIALFCFGPN